MMIVMVMSAILAGKVVLPQIDRNALELQARAEALQPRAAPPGRARPSQRPVPRRASGGSPLDLASITTICRAAGGQADPAGFIARLSHAYSLSRDDATSLRSSCAAYLAGRADARQTAD